MTVIIVRVSNVCQELRLVILSLLEKEIAKNSVIEDNTVDGQIFLPEEVDNQKIKLIIWREFSKNRDFDDYIVAGNDNDPHEIAILKN
jgi:hypothetical protein